MVAPALPQISGVSPTTAFNDRAIELVVTGANFVEGAIVRLGSNIFATNFTSSSSLLVIIEAGQAAGTYDLVVINPNDDQARLNNALTIEDAETSNYDDLFSSDDQFWADPLPARAGVPVNLGLFVQRSGGKQVLEDVPVAFYRDAPTGTPLSTGIVPLLDPVNGINSTRPVTVTFPNAGEVTLYAVIDPNRLFTEDNEENNIYRRTIIVGAAPGSGADLTPPTVDGIGINGGEVTNVTSRDITVAVRASDPTQPTRASGVRYTHLIEYLYLESVGNWVPMESSDWLPFDVSPEEYAWTLLPQPGMRYIQVRARDGAGNISIGQARRLLNYEPESDSITLGQTRIYRYEVAAGQSLQVDLEVLDGDADLYVWSSQTDQSARVSNLPGSAAERVRVEASQIVPGLYQVEVFGYTAATYRITTLIGPTAGRAPTKQRGGISQAKELPTAPRVGVGSIPDERAGSILPTPVASTQQVYLPLVRR